MYLQSIDYSFPKLGSYFSSFLSSAPNIVFNAYNTQINKNAAVQTTFIILINMYSLQKLYIFSGIYTLYHGNIHQIYQSFKQLKLFDFNEYFVNIFSCESTHERSQKT